MMKLKKTLLVVFLLVQSAFLHAKEGMWIPSLLHALNIEDMQRMGLQLDAEDLYSINQGSLKDAICRFGGGCTGEIISDQGLLLTNHHCGFSAIQSHSSVENDYLGDGFWAMSQAEELSNPGLTATFVVSIEDVSDELKDADGNFLSGGAMLKKQQELIDKATEVTYYEGQIKPFNYGNAYFMVITITYEDVRLVGAPPSSIGKYGHDTDNWVWPRHTGDFSMFRVYADKNNNPAPYSEDNVPYKPKEFLKINMEGVKEGDFTMVYGFPGRTQQFLTSYAVDYTINTGNPARINMRDHSLAVINEAMRSDQKIKIQYASKQARIANGWKKWIGENFGLKSTNALEKKVAFEQEYQKRADGHDEFKDYRNVLSDLKDLYAKDRSYNLAHDYYIEMIYLGPEIIRYSESFLGYLQGIDGYDDAKLAEEYQRLSRNAEGYFKNYQVSVDKGIMKELLTIFIDSVDHSLIKDELLEATGTQKASIHEFVDELFEESIFASQERVMEFLDGASPKSAAKLLKKDPMLSLMMQLFNGYRELVGPTHGLYQQQIEGLMQTYVEGIERMFPEKTYWYDANSTLRLTYGKVEGSSPRDGMRYEFMTTMEGVMAKYKPGDYEFDLPQKLIDLYNKKDYGIYADASGKMPVCFTGSNHTTGGNSGSPALDANGYLVGLNFDRSWESTMSDIMYNKDICRNIMVDIRYVLFIVDKFGGAGHLVDEMVLVTEEYRKEQEQVEKKRELKEITNRLKTERESPELLTRRGNIYVEMGLYEDAIRDFDAALVSDKKFASAYAGKSDALLLQEKPEDAIVQMQKAMQYDSENTDYMFGLGLAYFDKGEYKRAVSYFDKVILRHPTHHKAFYNRGVCYHLLGEKERGCEDINAAQRIGGNEEYWIYENICE